MSEQLLSLQTGAPVIFGTNRITRVSEELAAAFVAGDRLLVVQSDGTLLHIPQAEHDLVDRAVTGAAAAFSAMGSVDDQQISSFFEAFANRLDDDSVFAAIEAANRADVTDARQRGRSTTRLVLTSKMRADMVSGLRSWAAASGRRDETVEVVAHEGWSVEQRRAGLGVVGFVFEGRPNVFADATGVLRSGNTVVFRIGSDALATARAITREALGPALSHAGLPAGAVTLLDSPSRATGWALFSHPRLALAVARGSGRAVEQLGSVARQAGTPVSLHGTGGAWIMTSRTTSVGALGTAVLHSLDRKVCNTMNVCCIVRSRADELAPVVLAAIERAAGRRGTEHKVHVVEGSESLVPGDWFGRQVSISRADGPTVEPRAESIAIADLGTEWEWEDSPEVTLVAVEDLDEAVELFNRYSPRLVASLIADDEREHDHFWRRIDAPFVGNGFTRWVDGQFALGRPELGLSNWEHGRLFGRSAVLSGDSVFTLRTRAHQRQLDLHR